MIDSWFKNPVIRRRSIIISSVLLALILLISFLPTYLARYYLTDLLNTFDIQHEGIKSMRVNLWKREIWIGPVSFRAGESDYGKLGELGIKVNLLPTVKKHALVDKFIVRNIDIVLQRNADNSITINGISLDKFITTDEAEQPKQKKSSNWGVGLVDLDIYDSRLVFINENKGALDTQIEHLHMENFESWNPDDPGNLNLKADINGFKIDITGQARPFAQHITLNLDTEVREFNLEKLARFIGPVHLQRIEGIYDSKLHHEITLFDDGRINGKANGQIKITGADYASKNNLAIAAQKTSLVLDGGYQYSEKGDLKLSGQLQVRLNDAKASLPGENDFDIGEASVVLNDMTTLLGADRSLQVSSKPAIEMSQVKYGGRLEISLDVFMQALQNLQRLSSPRGIKAAEKTGLEKWAGDEVILPRSDVMIEKLSNTFKKLELNTTAGRVTVDIASQISAAGVQIDSGKRTMKIKSTQNKFDALQLRSGEGKVDLKLVSSAQVDGFTSDGPIGKGGISRIDVDQDIDLAINQGDIALQGNSKTETGKIDITIHKTESLPQAKLDVGGLKAEVKKFSFSLAKKNLKWAVQASSSIKKAAIKYAEGENTSAKFDRIELHDARVDQNFNVYTDRLLISGLDGLVTRQLIDGAIKDYGDEQPATAGDEVQKSKDSEDKSQTVKRDVVIGQFVLDKGAHLRFRDVRVQPPVIVDLDIDRMELKDVDTTKPEKQAVLELLAKINEFTNIQVNGKGKNVGPKANMEITGKIENLELPAYSSYTAEFGGVYLEKGELNTQLDVKAKQGELGGAIKLNVKQLEFTPLSDSDAQRLSEKAGMPIETAASLLKDKNGNIDLNLPITGSVTSPNVDIGSAISKAIGNALKAIFPPTMILSLLSSATGGQDMTFEPVKFTKGSSDLDKEAKKYLDGLVTLLKERPQLEINVCGRATPADFEAITFISLKLKPGAKQEAIDQRVRLIQENQAEMLKLATERTRAVKRYLVSEKGIETRKVGECRPMFDPEDQQPPRVVVTL